MKTVIQWSNQRMQISNETGVHVAGITAPDKNGYTPIELLTSSLGLCIFTTISRMFERDGIDVKEDEFSVTVQAKKAEGGPSRVEQFLISTELPQHLELIYRKKLIRSAEKACTIGSTIRHGAEINITDKGMVNSG